VSSLVGIISITWGLMRNASSWATPDLLILYQTVVHPQVWEPKLYSLQRRMVMEDLMSPTGWVLFKVSLLNAIPNQPTLISKCYSRKDLTSRVLSEKWVHLGFILFSLSHSTCGQTHLLITTPWYLFQVFTPSCLLQRGVSTRSLTNIYQGSNVNNFLDPEGSSFNQSCLSSVSGLEFILGP
jgi:hypothetical protein